MPRETKDESTSQPLAAEDDAAAFQALTTFMEKAGFTAIMCASRADALEHIRRGEGPLVVADIGNAETGRSAPPAKPLQGQEAARYIIYTRLGRYQSAKGSSDLRDPPAAGKSDSPVDFIRQAHRALEMSMRRRARELAEAVAERTRELTLANEALCVSEQKYCRLVEDLRFGVYVVDRDYHITMVNEAIAKLLDKDPSDLLGRKCFEVLRKRETVCPNCPGVNAIATGEPTLLQTQALRDDGRVVHLRTQAFSNCDAEGQVCSVTLVAEDITDRMQSDATQRLQSEIMANMPGGVSLIRSADGMIVYTNQRFDEFFGYQPGELIGEHISIGHAPTEKSPRRTAEAIIDAVALSGSWRGEIPCIRKDGTTFWCYGSVSEFDHPVHGKVLVGIYTDITELKQAGEQLRQAQKMEAVGRLAGGIAHDFRNQLTVIKGYAEMLLRRSLVTAEGREKVKEILKAGENSATLSGQLLAFSRKEILKPKVVPVYELVADMTGALQKMIGEDTSLTIRPCDHECLALLDTSMLYQAVLNLAANARDAMPTGGTVTLAVEPVDVDPEATPAPDIPPGRYICLSVTDTGSGMDEQEKAQIFEPYFSTKEAGKGTGLGLAMVYGFVSQSGGFVEVTSSPGEGSTFRLCFPAANAATEPAAPNANTGESLRGIETVLLAEDEEAVRQIAAASLRELGYRVIEAGSAREALRLAEHTEYQIDLLVTDVVMPDGSGLDIAGPFRDARPDVPILYISGYADEDLQRRGIESDQIDILAKPFNHDQLLVAVRSALDARKSTPPAG